MGKNWKDRKDWHLDGHIDPSRIGFGEQPSQCCNYHDSGGPENQKCGRDYYKGVSKGVSTVASEVVVAGSTYKHCHHTGSEKIFEIKTPGGMISFGGATGYDLDQSCASLVLDLAHVFADDKKSFIRQGPPEWLALNQLVRPAFKIIRFDWNDQKAPGNVPVRFWHSAVKLIARALPTGGHVIATCVGGHGRTGTCLASILIAHGDRSAMSAVDYIRERHCDQAIESQAQEQYLERLAKERDHLKGEKKEQAI